MVEAANGPTTPEGDKVRMLIEEQGTQFMSVIPLIRQCETVLSVPCRVPLPRRQRRTICCSATDNALVSHSMAVSNFCHPV